MSLFTRDEGTGAWANSKIITGDTGVREEGNSVRAMLQDIAIASREWIGCWSGWRARHHVGHLPDPAGLDDIEQNGSSDTAWIFRATLGAALQERSRWR